MTKSAGWWKTKSPDARRLSPTDFRERLTFAPDTNADALLLRVRLHDEKGEVDFMLRLRRVGANGKQGHGFHVADILRVGVSGARANGGGVHDTRGLLHARETQGLRAESGKEGHGRNGK